MVDDILFDRLVTIRRQLHQNPELGFQEFTTSTLVQENLQQLDIPFEKSPYVNIIVSRDDNKTQENVLKFVKSYQSPEVEQAAETAFKGGAIKGW